MTAPPKPLITVDALGLSLGDPSLRLVDVRWTLGRPGEGRAAWQRTRLPGASFLDVDADLSQPLEARHGRHPLPSPRHLVERLFAVGIGQGARVVVYDDAGGATAARLWWLLRWIGHDDVAVLDGGWKAWLVAGRPIETGEAGEPGEPVEAAVGSELPASRRAVRALEPETRNTMVAVKHEIEALVDACTDEPSLLLLDARAPERYRGEVEPIDPRPGHIPGARNAPFSENLRSAAPTFLPVDELRRRYASVGLRDDGEVICYCGSGVTACHDLLALDLIGHPRDRVRLYAGSYSEWANDPRLSVITGPEPRGPRTVTVAAPDSEDDVLDRPAKPVDDV